MSSSKKQSTIGYNYYMGLHMGICHGPVDAVLKIKIGDREAWTGTLTTSTTTSISAPELFGGPEREGGVQGLLDVMMGEPTQQANAYLSDRQGGQQPAYRGLLGVVFRQGLIAANNPYIKPWAFKLRRILQGWQGGSGAWYPEKAVINLSSGDQAMNVAHIAYEILTNVEWGMAYGAAQLDDANFRAAADTFHAEGLGLCMKWTRQETIEKFLQIVMDHAGAVLRQDKRTGLFQIKPIRADYDVETLPLFDQTNIVAVESYQRPSIVEAVNELVVTYDDVTTGKRGSITVQNLANITAQGGVLTKTQSYPGIPTADLAIRVALRDLNAISSALSKVRFTVDRKAWQVLPGDVLRLSWPKLGITNLTCRVLRVSGGTLTNGRITIEATEDVFGLPATGYAQQQPVGWQDPATNPQPAARRIIEEAPYYLLQTTLGAGDLAVLEPEAGYLYTAAVRPSSDSTDYTILTNSGGPYEQAGFGDFCPSAVLAEAISPTATEVEIEDLVDSDLIASNRYAYLGNEIIRIVTFNPATSMLTIGRGLMDSVATAHPQTARIFFVDNYGGSDELERIDGETVNVKLLPATGTGRLTEGEAPADVVTFDQRAYRPYPPGQLRINEQAYPDIIESDTLTVSWAHRNRLQQNLEGDESGDIGPEPGTTYTVRLINDADESVIQTHTGITDNTKDLDPLLAGEYDLTVELWSVRDSLDSRQKHIWPFHYVTVAQPPEVVAFSATEFSTALSQTRTIPIETQEGDLLVACVMHRDSITPPAGWTLVEQAGPFTDGTFSQSTSVFTKTAVSGDEGSPATFTQSSSQRMGSHIIVVRHDLPLSVAASANFIDESTVSNELDIAEVAATGANQLAITALSFIYNITGGTSTLVVSPGWTQTTPDDLVVPPDGNSLRLGVAYQVISSPAQTIGQFTRTSTSGSPIWGSATIIVEASEPAVAARYWRVTDISVDGTGLEISELQLLEAGTVKTQGVAISASDPHDGGVALSTLNDGVVSTGFCPGWSSATVEQGTDFWIQFDLGAGNEAAIDGAKQAGRDTNNRFMSAFTVQYSDDGVTWTTKASLSGLTYPGNATLSELYEL